MLARYATRFPVVEINSSFYRPHLPATYARWAASVPASFRFAVKMPRTISHELALRGTGAALDRFLAETGALGANLGGYLLQLPPSLALDMRSATGFLRAFRTRTDAPLVVEPRHASWFNPRVEPLFEQFGISRAAADPTRFEPGHRPNAEPRWPYWRWHGSPQMYYSDYSEQDLQALAAETRHYARAPMAPWVIFDNTAHDHAIANAARLQELMASPRKTRKRAHA